MKNVSTVKQMHQKWGPGPFWERFGSHLSNNLVPGRFRALPEAIFERCLMDLASIWEDQKHQNSIKTLIVF